LENNFNKIYLEPNIFYIENFLSNEEIEKILSFEYNWMLNRNDFHQNVLTSSFVNQNELSFFHKTVENRLRLVVDNDNQKFKRRNMLTKYLPKNNACPPKCGCLGNSLGYHYENHPECDYESRWITFGIVIYFNDDYDGGELIFEHKPINIKPKKGTLMVFPATEEYSHAVKRVKTKERIVFAGFVYEKTYWDILERASIKI